MQVRDEKVDAMINKLLEVRGKKPGKNVQLSEEDIKHLCTKSRELFISQPNLLELEAPIKICGKFLYSISLSQPLHEVQSEHAGVMFRVWTWLIYETNSHVGRPRSKETLPRMMSYMSNSFNCR